jgi:hypothetical protein
MHWRRHETLYSIGLLYVHAQHYNGL